MLQDPAKEHVEVLHDRPGLCPDCLDRYITGRGGGKIELVARDGKWVCPRSGKSLAQEYGDDVGTLASGLGAVPVFAVPTMAFGIGLGTWLGKLLRWKRRRPTGAGDEPRRAGRSA